MYVKLGYVIFRGTDGNCNGISSSTFDQVGTTRAAFLSNSSCKYMYKGIMKTYPCNILQYFTAVKIVIFR